MKAKVVIGSGYGDEGKGVFTNQLSMDNDKSMVIRFNGGAQAGHTVFSPAGTRHVFGHFTANSFIPNSRGYFSSHFIINPIIYLQELHELNNKGVYPVVAAHDDCYITTPYDMLINRWLEKSRGDGSRHGSCGIGIGETIHRSEIVGKPLQLKDTESLIRLRDKMRVISSFFEKRVRELGLKKYYEENGLFLHETVIYRFIQDIIDMKKSLKTGVNNFKHDYFKDYSIIFEGAQGLMLDQNIGEFPYVTRSNTGLKNVIDICIENEVSEIDVVYVTRCYKTRHGAGSLKHELNHKPYSGIVDQTNIFNEFQGTLRFAYLDIDELFDFINKDLKSVEEKVKKNKIFIDYKIGITCLDQTDTVLYYDNEKLKKINSNDFYKIIESKNIKTLTRFKA